MYCWAPNLCCHCMIRLMRWRAWRQGTDRTETAAAAVQAFAGQIAAGAVFDSQPLRVYPVHVMMGCCLPGGACCFSTGRAAVTAPGAQQLTRTAARCLCWLMLWMAVARGSLLLRQQLVLSSRVKDTHTGFPAKGCWQRHDLLRLIGKRAAL